MKKLVINISETTYEKLRLQSMHEKKSIVDVIVERIFEKPFHSDVEDAYGNLLNIQYQDLGK
jgi:hypothetical protein